MKKVKICTFIFASFGLFFYFLIKWLGTNFGSNLTTEQIIWTALNSPTQADSSLIFSFGLLLLKVGLLTIPLFFLVFRLDGLAKILLFAITHPSQTIRLLKLVIKEWLAKFKYSYLVVLLLVISLCFCGIQLKRLDKRYGVYPFIVTQLKAPSDDFIAKNFFIPNDKEISFPFKRDLVIVLAESFEESFFDKKISNEPILDSSMKKERESSLFSKNMQQVLGTSWTIAATTAWHFGLPLKLPSFINGNQYFSKRGFFPGAKSIFEILNQNGYETVLILGSDSNFSNKRTLFTEHGNFKIMDRQYWQQKGWDLDKFQGTGWGFNDNFVLDRAYEEYIKLKEQGKPFVLFVETVDTHAPDGWAPPQYCTYKDIRDSFDYVDKALTNFVKKIKSTKSSNTALAVLGDHLFMGDKPYLTREKRRIFNMFWTPNISTIKFNSDRPISALDIAPTLLELSGCRWSKHQYGLGESIFSDKPTLLQKYSLETLNKELAKPSKFIQKLY